MTARAAEDRTGQMLLESCVERAVVGGQQVEAVAVARKTVSNNGTSLTKGLDADHERYSIQLFDVIALNRIIRRLPGSYDFVVSHLKMCGNIAI